MASSNIENIHQMQVINFRSRDFHASIDIDKILKVIALPNIEAIPVGPNYLIGIINISGAVVPVIDLSMKLSFEKPKKYTVNTPILICKNKESMFGVVVDEVINIADIDEAMIDHRPIAKDSNQIISATIKYHDGMSFLMNVDFMFDYHEFHHVVYGQENKS